jgi:HD-GYP domain-containing protein (c-di-GMP phosphodiesterase class II)
VITVVATTAAAATAVGAIFIRPPFDDWSALLLVVALVAVLEQRGSVSLPVGRVTIRFSGKAYASIGAVYLLGLPAAAASSVAYLLTSLVLRRQVPLKMVFNSAMCLLMYSSAYWAFEALRQATKTEALRHATSPDVLWLILAGALGGVAAWAVNNLLLGLVISADQGARSVRSRVYVRGAVDLLPYYVGYGLTGLGVVAASVWLGAMAALVTLAAPVAIVQTATNRWMREQQARVTEAKSGFNATLISLSKAIDLRDNDTEGHCRRVVEYSLMMGRFLKFDDDELIRLCHGALLHDIGKIGIPDAILHKPGPLTDEEWQVMRTHPQLGALLVADVRQLERAREVILNHHERFDGRGYPRGLTNDQVPLAARVFTIADAFDAMISDRPYRKAMSLTEARAEVRRCSGTQFDPTCVEAFESISDESLKVVGNKKEQLTEELLSL